MSLLRMHRASLFTVLLLWFGVLVWPLQAQKVDQSSFVFLSNKDNTRRGFDLFLHSTSGEKPLNLTKNTGDAGITSASSPRLLTKRNSIIYFSSLSRSFKELSLVTMTIRTLADIMYEAPQYDLSPDQRFLLYTERVDTSLQLVELDLLTCAKQNLTNNKFDNIEPRYSPDGGTIAFVSTSDGSHSIAVMNRDGSGQRILTNHFGDDRHPSFSPDGNRIVFASSRSAIAKDEYDLYIIDTNGRNFTMVYDNTVYSTRPEFSSDGQTIVFVSSNRAKKLSHVLLKDLTSGAVTDITNDLGFLCQNVSLSPDGRFLVFEHMTIADCEIMAYDVAARTLRNLTNSRSWDCSPSF